MAIEGLGFFKGVINEAKRITWISWKDTSVIGGLVSVVAVAMGFAFWSVDKILELAVGYAIINFHNF